MPQRTFPPDLFCAAHCDHFGRETAVQRRVPLGGDARLDGSQVVEACQHLSVCAVRAAGPVCAGRNHCLKAVSLLANPPHLAVTGQRDLLRGERSVSFRVPLRGKHRILCRKVVEAGQHQFSWNNIGQPTLLFVRAETAARQWCPCPQTHRPFSLSPAERPAGSALPLRVVSHSCASSGSTVARSFSPTRICLPAQTGQPHPEAREWMLARQLCPFSQRHQTGLWFPALTSAGTSGTFFL